MGKHDMDTGTRGASVSVTGAALFPAVGGRCAVVVVAFGFDAGACGGFGCPQFDRLRGGRVWVNRVRKERETGRLTLWKVALLALNMRSLSLGGSPGRRRFLSWAEALGALRYES